MSDRARLLRALLRQDLFCFVEKAFNTLEPGTAYEHNWHIEHLCWQLTRVARGEVRRLIINVPPRSMKSITVSVAFTAWLMGRDPRKRIICASYADDLARKLSIDTRMVMTSPWYRELFPGLQLAKRPKAVELVTTEQGVRYAAGMGGSVLGRGADLIIIDDPINSTDVVSQAERRRVNEEFDNTFYTRLNDKRTGAIVIIMQRLHQDDLVGHVLAKGDWEVVSIPAIATDESRLQLSDTRSGTESPTGRTEQQRGDASSRGIAERNGGSREHATDVRISTEQRTRIRSVVTREHVEPVRDINLTVSTGTVIPRDRIESIHLRHLPTEIVELVPECRGFDFFVYRDEIIIVDPATYRIVYIIEG